MLTRFVLTRILITRRKRQLFCAAICVIGCALWTIPAAAQTTSKATLETSETLFSVVGAIHSCGYGQDTGGEAIRAQVRSDIARNVAGSKEAQAASAELCTFYRDHQQPDSSRDLAQYISLALNLGDAPDFKLKVKEADLPPDANYVLGLVPLLKRFYAAAGLHKVWEAHRSQYEALVERYHGPVTKLLLVTDVYLRLPISGYLGRSFTIYLEPMAAPGQVNARNYGADYFMVVSPAANGSLGLEQIRHTYLHFIMDPLLGKYPTAMKKLEPLLKAVQTAPLEEDYKRDIKLLATESLIEAVEARLSASGKNAEPVRQREVEKAVAQGYVLTRYFYDRLAQFENGIEGLRDALPDWLYKLDVDREIKRASAIQFSGSASPEVMAVSRPKPGVLDLAEQRLAAGDYDSARQLAQHALDQKQEDAGRALFILAQVASLSKDMKGAREYFERATEVAKDPRVLAWSHIYLGRISDIQEDREAALQHYRAALAAGNVTPETRAAAERGLKEPYQPKRH
ncbi:MAG: hypothetical protein ACR2IF_18870 [Terriglobales bacterium]